MATCNDCIHHDVCERWARNIEEEFCVVTRTPCEKFKHESDFIEVKHGHWTNQYRNGFGTLIGYCSNCGYRDEADKHHCSNCGAKNG